MIKAKSKKTKKGSNNRLLILVGILFITNIILISKVFGTRISSFIQKKESVPQQQAKEDPLLEEINPPEGVKLRVKYGDLGPKMLEIGVIDLEKFKQIYDQSNEPLTQEQLDILTKGSDKEIKITRENSHFLLNFFWAVGLANKSKILDEGEMVKNGDTGNFASTGGWPLSSGEGMSYYSKNSLMSLTPEQEDLVQEVASNIYRPCCGNSTAFPDCNHGMALLGLLELMASQGASESQMYNLAKYVNAYWFTPNYYDLAQYFKAKEGKDFKDIDAKTILGKEFSSSSGYYEAKKWLIDKGLVKEPPNQGGSCGA